MMDEYLERIKGWAKGMRSVCAILLLSPEKQTVGDNMDLVIVSSEKDALITNTAWMEKFGEVDSYLTEKNGNLNCFRIFYEDGQELQISPVEPAWMTFPLTEKAKSILTKGFQTLYVDFDYLEILHQTKLALAR